MTICSKQRLYRKTVKMMGEGKSSMRCRQLGSLVRPTESGRSPPPTLRGKLLTSPASGNLLFDTKPTAGAAGLGMGKPQLSLGQRPPRASAHSNRCHPGMSTCHRTSSPSAGPEAINNVPVCASKFDLTHTAILMVELIMSFLLTGFVGKSRNDFIIYHIYSRLSTCDGLQQSKQTVA